MGLGTNHSTTTTQAEFIPELWSDQVKAAYKANLVLANLVKKLSFVGKRGDTMHVPVPTRGTAHSKTQGSQVTLNVDTATDLAVTVDQWWEYSKVIEDIVKVQSIPSMMAFYTDDAGYTLAKKIDSLLAALAGGFQGSTAYSTAVIGSDGSTVWSPSANTNTGNGAHLADAGFRRVIQTLDDADVPFDSRSLVIPPSEKNSILGIDRFNSRDFIGDDPRIKTGMLGDLYGVSTYVTTNLDTVQAADSSTNYKAAMLFHTEAMVLAMQQNVRSQSQYKLEYLGNLFVSDCIFGYREYRDEAGVAIIVPA